MKAKEMFKELGFEEIKRFNGNLSWRNGSKTIYEKPFSPFKNGVPTDFETIEFNLDERYYTYTTLLKSPMKTKIDIHNAITRQMKELGWLNV